MKTAKILVVGGGFAGCAAAIAAARSGAAVTLVERTDLLGGAGLRAGRMNANGMLVIAEEAKAVGGGDIFQSLESITLNHADIVGEEHGYQYDVTKLHATLHRQLVQHGVSVQFEDRAVDVTLKDSWLQSATLESGQTLSADAFVDCSGSFGGTDGCSQYGQGCVMCLHRCHFFGNRVSIATKAGVPALDWPRADGTPGRLSPSLSLYKESLDPVLRRALETAGSVTIPLPRELVDYSKEDSFRGIRASRQIENINLVDNGLLAKCIGLAYVSPDLLRAIPGFENAQIAHPWGGGIFNFVTHLGLSPRDDSLRVPSIGNLFVAGEKAGRGGIDIAIATGALAGHNSVRTALGREPLVLPTDTVIGDFIHAVTGILDSRQFPVDAPSAANGPFFERMKARGLYTTDIGSIHARIEKLGLTGILTGTIH